MVELPARMDRICVLARGVRVMEVSNPARGGTSLISHAHPSPTGARWQQFVDWFFPYLPGTSSTSDMTVQNIQGF